MACLSASNAKQGAPARLVSFKTFEQTIKDLLDRYVP
jgi:hypothetical protein